MKRVAVISFFSLLFAVLWQSLGMMLPAWANTLFLPSLVLVFSLQFCRPHETILIVLICGFIVDVIGGFVIGSNMLLMLVFAFALSATNMLAGRINKADLVYYVLVISFMYRLVLLVSQFILKGHQTNVAIIQLLTGPLIDGLMSKIFFWLVGYILHIVKAYEHTESFKRGGLL